MDLVNVATSAITPAIAGKIARSLGISEAIVQKVVAVGVPLVLAALFKHGSTAGGTTAVNDVMAALRKDSIGPLGSLLGSQGGDVAQASTAGIDRLGSLFGTGATSSMVTALAKYAGIDEKAAGPLLGLAGGAAITSLKAAADEQKLDAAGVQRLLGSQKDQLTRAIPAGLAQSLWGTGLLPDMQRLAAQAVPTVPPASSIWVKWLAIAAAILVLIWLGSKLMGGRETPVATTPTPPTATTAASPLAVNGVDIGDKVKTALGELTTALAGIKDVDSAKAALDRLTGVDTSLAGIASAVTGLPAEGKSALATLINAALPAIKTAVEPLIADAAIGPVVKPILDSVLGRLSAYAG